MNDRQLAIMAYIAAYPGCSKEAIIRELGGRGGSRVTVWNEIEDLKKSGFIKVEKKHNRRSALEVTNKRFKFKPGTPKEIQEYLIHYYNYELQIEQIRQAQAALEQFFNNKAKVKGLKLRVQGNAWFDLK